MSVELQPSLVLDPEQYAASQTELHALYNRHVAKKDALKTIKKIPTGSVVYMEGLRLETLYKNDLRELAVDLGRHARIYGRDKDYYKAKDEISGEFRRNLSGKKGKDDAYEGLLYSTLIDKDCQIVPADYIHITNPDLQDEINIVTDYISQWYQAELNIGKGLYICDDEEQYFSDLADVVHGRWQSVEVREECATGIITQDLADLALYQHFADTVPRAKNGKMKAFMVYGASHKHSLTRRLSDSGIDVVTHDVSGVDGGMYIHEPYEQFQNNFMRTIAFTAFLAATWKMANLPGGKEKEDDAPMAEIHESLTRLNGDDEATLEFCSRCLRIQKTADRHPKKSLKAYWKLVDDYSAS